MKEITQEKKEAIVEMVATGKPMSEAAEMHGLRSLDIKHAEQEDAEFAHRMKLARMCIAQTTADAMFEVFQQAQNGGDDIGGEGHKFMLNWARQVLPKFDPALWGDKQTVQNEGAMKIEVEYIKPEINKTDDDSED